MSQTSHERPQSHKQGNKAPTDNELRAMTKRTVPVPRGHQINPKTGEARGKDPRFPIEDRPRHRNFARLIGAGTAAVVLAGGGAFAGSKLLNGDTAPTPKPTSISGEQTPGADTSHVTTDMPSDIDTAPTLKEIGDIPTDPESQVQLLRPGPETIRSGEAYMASVEHSTNIMLRAGCTKELYLKSNGSYTEFARLAFAEYPTEELLQSIYGVDPSKLNPDVVRKTDAVRMANLAEYFYRTQESDGTQPTEYGLSLVPEPGSITYVAHGKDQATVTVRWELRVVGQPWDTDLNDKDGRYFGGDTYELVAGDSGTVPQ